MNRLGLKGAHEVKEHVWLKYYPWKELYDKNLVSPFNPKVGDNFDSKYCNAPEKLGMQTKERYESHMRDEAVKQVFKDFYFYYNEHDSNDRNNTKEKKFYNLHTTLVNNKQNERLPTNGSVELNKNSNNFETKLTKIKQLSSSNSSGSLFNKARQSVSTATGGSNNVSSQNSSSVFKKSGSVSNFRY